MNTTTTKSYNFTQGAFAKKVLTLMAGASIAQILPIAVSPILAHIYSVTDFGIFGLFLAIVNVLMVVANGRYELAILLPEDESEAVNIAALCLVISFIISFTFLFALLIKNIFFSAVFFTFPLWYYLIPLSIFMVGLYNSLNYFNIRKKQYADIAKATVYKSFALVTFQVAFSFTSFASIGLMLGYVISQFFCNGKLLRNIELEEISKKVSYLEMKRLAYRYINFPKYSMWGDFINRFAFSAISFFIAYCYSPLFLGYYILVQRIFGTTSSFIASSFSQVYLQESSSEKNSTGLAINSFKYTFIKLLMFGLLISLIIVFCVKPIILIFFGEKWLPAVSYSQILIPYLLASFLSSSLSVTLSVFEKQKLEFIIQFLLMTTILLLILFSWYFAVSLILFFKLLSFLLFVEYLIFIYIYRQLSRGEF